MICEFSKHELKMIIDALQFTCCGDICSEVQPEKCTEMAELSVKLCKQIDYKSEENFYIDDCPSDDEERLNIIKDYVRKEIWNVKDEDTE